MKAKFATGFTLIEVLVVIVIMGILAAVAVPKLFASVAKAKASEIAPAAGTYQKLQDLHLMEKASVGTWKSIGYEAPGSGTTTNFTYCGGEVSEEVKYENFGEESKVGWQATNNVSLNECSAGHWWFVSIKLENSHTAIYSTETNAEECIALAKPDWTVASRSGMACGEAGSAAETVLKPTDVGYTVSMGTFKKGGWSSAGMGSGWIGEMNDPDKPRNLENGVNVGMAGSMYATQNELRSDKLFELQPNSTYTFTVVTDETDENGKNIWGNTEKSNNGFLQTAIRVYTNNEGAHATIACESKQNQETNNTNSVTGKKADFNAEATITTNEKGQKVTTFTITTGNEASYFGANVYTSGVNGGFNSNTDVRRTAAEKAITEATLTLTETKAQSPSSSSSK